MRAFTVKPRRDSDAEIATATESFLNRVVEERFPEPREFHRWCLMEFLKGRSAEEVGEEAATMFLGKAVERTN